MSGARESNHREQLHQEGYGQLSNDHPQDYLKDMRRRDPGLSKGWGQIATPLSVQTAGGLQKLNCANTQGNPVHSVARAGSGCRVGPCPVKNCPN